MQSLVRGGDETCRDQRDAKRSISHNFVVYGFGTASSRKNQPCFINQQALSENCDEPYGIQIAHLQIVREIGLQDNIARANLQ